ncbi:COG4315 family predicted lipoprotein [Parasulfitobacter algicola]|uniref:Lipoprotein n=1 Tax=Parasulfitobacter algicola TaxID=2614809 RepID=A0ABX2IKK9_9RHOB|nr:hypothetical protein [Sulfitobacter algicola]NSX53417.1 hypothetical protein [Sulfitobacter algicola]
MKLFTVITLAVLAVASSQAYSAAHKSVLAAKNGMTLYTFDKDKAGTSNCYNDCADSWPPYTAKRGMKPPVAGLTTIKRRDGTFQWAQDGMPLYFWVGDSKPGDTNGDGVGGVWHVARP